MTLARPRLHQLAYLALLIGAAVALLPRVALTFYTFPSTDDYCIVAETRDAGFWYMQVHSYLTWTGRYSAVFLESIISQFDLIAGYPWFALLTLLLTLASIHALVASVIGNELSHLRVTVIALTAAAQSARVNAVPQLLPLPELVQPPWVCTPTAWPVFSRITGEPELPPVVSVW